MKRVLILGATGMLGSAIYSVLKKDFELVLAVRNRDKVRLLEQRYGDTAKHRVEVLDCMRLYAEYAEKKGHSSAYLQDFLATVGDVDHAINAIGVTIPFALQDPAMTFFVNGALPHVLARVLGPRLIHITTDCVYSGKRGFPYDECSTKNPVDLYGLSKSLGEPIDCLTIRTSIIGRELDGFTGLLEWFLARNGNDVTGFGEHYWNGITTQEFGEICRKIMLEPEKYPRIGLFHVFSTVVSKYDMLEAFKKKYRLTTTIRRDNSAKLNRTLTSVRALNSLLGVPSFSEMVEAMQP